MGRIPGDDPDLRLRNNHVDVRNIVGNVVFKAIAQLEPECQPAMFRPKRLRGRMVGPDPRCGKRWGLVGGVPAIGWNDHADAYQAE